MIIAGLVADGTSWRYGNWRHVATGCNALVWNWCVRVCMCRFLSLQFVDDMLLFIFSERSLYAIARPSVVCLSVCNVRAPYSSGSDFRQYFYGIKYLGHPWTSTENFTDIVPGEPHPPGELNTRGVAKYSDFGHINGYISEMVQDRR